MAYIPEPMRFATLDTSEAKMRCANCMQPHRAHRPRMSAPPLCPSGRGVYREATEEELSEAYKAQFPDGAPGPLATFDLKNPADVERAKSLFSPDALHRFFGPDGGGLPALEAAIRDGETEGKA